MENVENSVVTEMPKPAVRRKILYVDDVSFQLTSAKERLKKFYEVYPAQSIESMFETLSHIRPEIILLDVNMPDADGFEVIKQLKEDARYAEIPVIFLTAKVDRENVIKGMRLGAVDFIKKPFSDMKLIECIEYQLDATKKDEDKPIILAVDDNASILRSVNYLLSSRYKVYTLAEPLKLKAMLSMVTPDLFLLDCNMPELNGFDLVPVIRETREHKETPIMFLTSEGTIDNISVAINLGACDFITKPINDNILREKIDQRLADFVMMRRIRSL
jgi:PleD family two-component response regulator